MPRDDHLDLSDDVMLGMWIRPSVRPTQEVSVVRLGQRLLEVLMGPAGQLLVQAQLTSGTVTLPTDIVPVGEWIYVTAGVRDNKVVATLGAAEYEKPGAGTLLADSRVSFGLRIGGGVQAGLSNVGLFDLTSSPMLKLSDGSQSGTVTVSQSGTAVFSVATTGVTSTAAERIQRRMQREYRGAEGGLVGTAYAAEVSEYAGTPPPKFDSPYDAATKIAEYIQECDFLEGLKRQAIRVRRADGWVSRSVETIELLGYINLTASVLATRAALSAPDCLVGLVTGNTDTVAGAVCDFVSGFFVVGDIRDFLLHEYFWAVDSRDKDVNSPTYGKPKYDVAVHTLAGLGLIAALAVVATGGVAIPAKAAVNGAKTAVKVLRGLGGVMVDFARVSFDWLKRAVLDPPGSTTAKLKRLDQVLPFIQLIAALGLEWDKFMLAGRAIGSLVVNSPQHIGALAGYVAGVVTWWEASDLDEDSDDPTAMWGGLVGVAYAQSFFAKQPVRVVLQRFQDLRLQRAGMQDDEVGQAIGRIVAEIEASKLDLDAVNETLISRLYEQKTFRAFDHLERVQSEVPGLKGDLLMSLRKTSTRQPSPTGQSVGRLIDDLAAIDPKHLDDMTPEARAGFTKMLLDKLDIHKKKALDADYSPADLAEGQVKAALTSAEGAMEEVNFSFRQVVQDTGAPPINFQIPLPAVDSLGKPLGKNSARVMDSLVTDGSKLKLNKELPSGPRYIDNKAFNPNSLERSVVLDIESTGATGGELIRDVIAMALTPGSRTGPTTWTKAGWNRTWVFAKAPQAGVMDGLPALAASAMKDSGHARALIVKALDLKTDAQVQAFYKQLPALMSDMFRARP